MTLDEIVSDYIREYRDHARKEMRFFEIQRSASAAIRKAALWVLPAARGIHISGAFPGLYSKRGRHGSRRLDASLQTLPTLPPFINLWKTLLGTSKALGRSPCMTSLTGSVPILEKRLGSYICMLEQ